VIKREIWVLRELWRRVRVTCMRGEDSSRRNGWKKRVDLLVVGGGGEDGG